VNKMQKKEFSLNDTTRTAILRAATHHHQEDLNKYFPDAALEDLPDDVLIDLSLQDTDLISVLQDPQLRGYLGEPKDPTVDYQKLRHIIYIQKNHAQELARIFPSAPLEKLPEDTLRDLTSGQRTLAEVLTDPEAIELIGYPQTTTTHYQIAHRFPNLYQAYPTISADQLTPPQIERLTRGDHPHSVLGPQEDDSVKLITREGVVTKGTFCNRSKHNGPAPRHVHGCPRSTFNAGGRRSPTANSTQNYDRY